MNHALSTEAYNPTDGGVATDGGETNPTDPAGMLIISWTEVL